MAFIVLNQNDTTEAIAKKCNENFKRLDGFSSRNAFATMNQFDNLNYFSNISVDDTLVTSDSIDDTLSIVIGDHMIIIGNDSNDSVSFAVEELTAAQVAALLT